jgi:leader peptidase (prepilin peptidase)/N-methyltransferase
LLGACFGSFFNVCIYRIPKGVALSLPPSHCYRCGKHLRWFDNIPLLSYWALGGRCRFCKAPFSIRYFLVELLTAILFTLVFVRYCNPGIGYSLVFIPGIIFTSLLIIASFTDIDHWIIPDRISIGGTIAGIALAAAWPIGLAPHNPLAKASEFVQIPEKFVPVANSLAGAAAGFALLWLIGVLGTFVFRKEAMGRGDMKLMAMFGAFTGPLNILFILILSSVMGSIVGLVSLAFAKLRKAETPAAIAALEPNIIRVEQLIQSHDLTPAECLVVTRALTNPGAVGPLRHHLPFGPSLAVAAFIVYLFWEEIQNWFYSLVLGPTW